jgi:hypothetical protein
MHPELVHPIVTSPSSEQEHIVLGAPLLVGGVMIASVVVVQAIVITAIVELMRRQTLRDGSSDWLRGTAIFAQALLLMVAAQLVEVAVWAALFVALGEFGQFSAAFYHSAVNFTTLGYGDIVMSPEWRLLGPLEAVAGMLMFGISTAVLFAITDALVRAHEERLGRRRDR